MKIRYHRTFNKSYKTRISDDLKLVSQFRKRLARFIENPQDPILKDHALTGIKRTFRAFSVTGDVRVIYRKLNDGIELVDIGSHNQVY